jgi:D-arabinose 5-phosphate isomerase GutQ
MGIYLLAGRGTGKSRLMGRKIAMQDYLAGFPQVIFDPVGQPLITFWTA